MIAIIMFVASVSSLGHCDDEVYGRQLCRATSLTACLRPQLVLGYVVDPLLSLRSSLLSCYACVSIVWQRRCSLFSDGLIHN